MRSVTAYLLLHLRHHARGLAAKTVGYTEIGLLDERLYYRSDCGRKRRSARAAAAALSRKGARTGDLHLGQHARDRPPARALRLGGAEDGVDVDVTEQAAILHGQNLYAAAIAPVSKMVADRGAEKRRSARSADALLAVSGNPAALLGLPDRGDIAPGYRDAINLIASDGTLEQTVVSGRVYVKGEEMHDLRTRGTRESC
jgi:hypothetical protein